MTVVDDYIQDVQNIAVENIPLPDLLRPENPGTMDFRACCGQIPDGFHPLQRDVTVGGVRHIIFAIPEQLQLQTSSTSSSASTHSLGRKTVPNKIPRYLCSCHEEENKITRKHLKKTKEPQRTEECVQPFVLHFEAAMWETFKALFPESKAHLRPTTHNETKLASFSHIFGTIDEHLLENI
ncbi:hypothetical protein MAR_019935 [Mya arenaria]|uniref:Uncharacterized protein n=1 Tax=Mya arenaria TaxID=6604 RepID=A0ABY7E6I9_MYAAR|nr:hypothetical protein MAR_019935 [Mya arenaria]